MKQRGGDRRILRLIFHLETEDRKTKLVEFGRFAETNARKRGKKPESFDFLGFTHYCGKTRQGAFKVRRKTSSKKFHAKLDEFTKWIRDNRMRLCTGELLKRAQAPLSTPSNWSRGREVVRHLVTLVMPGL